MKMETISLLEWQHRFSTEEACAEALAKVRWPGGFICPKCGETKYSYVTTRHMYQCSRCQRQTSVTAGTLFHSTNLPLTKWFWGIYLCAADKRGVSALKLSKDLNITWRSAQRMLRKIRQAMSHRDSICRLEGLIESDDTVLVDAFQAFFQNKQPDLAWIQKLLVVTP